MNKQAIIHNVQQFSNKWVNRFKSDRELTEQELKQWNQERETYLDLIRTLPRSRLHGGVVASLRAAQYTAQLRYGRVMNVNTGYSYPGYRSICPMVESAKRAIRRIRSHAEACYENYESMITLTCDSLENLNLSHRIRDFIDFWRDIPLWIWKKRQSEGRLSIWDLKCMDFSEFFAWLINDFPWPRFSRDIHSLQFVLEAKEAFEWLKNYVPGPITYLWVVEVQSRPHIHMLSNISYVPWVFGVRLWGSNFQLTAITDHSKNAIINYLVGYVKKTDNEWLLRAQYAAIRHYSKRMFSSSRHEKVKREKVWFWLDSDPSEFAMDQFLSQQVYYEWKREYVEPYESLVEDPAILYEMWSMPMSPRFTYINRPMYRNPVERIPKDEKQMIAAEIDDLLNSIKEYRARNRIINVLCPKIGDLLKMEYKGKVTVEVNNEFYHFDCIFGPDSDNVKSFLREQSNIEWDYLEYSELLGYYEISGSTSWKSIDMEHDLD